ncbi:MAG: type II toxin-antitoxin system VapC family toxin [Bacteroidetes bacterium]|nr:type II toxin-antitoxin system VapC family toxin [Bacteroidota bacterium]
MKIDFLADTNFLIYLHEGNESIKGFLGYDYGISVVSEIELLSYKKLSPDHEKKLKRLIQDCFSIDLSPEIKNITIELKKEYSVKLPDAIIAASAIQFGIPLISADKQFRKIKGLDFICIDL